MFLIFAALTPMPILSTSLWFSTNQWLSLSRLLKSHLSPPLTVLIPNPSLLGSGTRSPRAAASTSLTSLAGNGDQTTSPSGTLCLFNSEPTKSGGAPMVKICAMASTRHPAPTPTNTLINYPTRAPIKVEEKIQSRKSLLCPIQEINLYLFLPERCIDNSTRKDYFTQRCFQNVLSGKSDKRNTKWRSGRDM